MRLIDADALKQAKCKWCVRKVCKRTGWTCGFINLIDNVPTAYDVEKVVKEMQRKSYFIFDQCYADGSICVLLTDDAADIVKRGGVE